MLYFTDCFLDYVLFQFIYVHVEPKDENDEVIDLIPRTMILLRHTPHNNGMSCLRFVSTRLHDTAVLNTAYSSSESAGMYFVLRPSSNKIFICMKPVVFWVILTGEI